uniref:hypothetical protein n=1 Tax=Pseudomonas sp. TaxID=306 RepID=UPI00258ABD92
GISITEMGTTMFRPNYTPVTFGAIVGRHAGHLFEPARFTALHAWLASQFPHGLNPASPHSFLLLIGVIFYSRPGAILP